MATYPLGIKRFTTKRNLLDDVDASHINDMQSEITAIEDTLGPNPHQDSTAYDTGWRWKTVKERLEYMIRGHHLPVFTLYNGASGSYNTDDGLHLRAMPAPSTVNDTHKLFSGSQIKIKRAGYYHFNAQVFFNATALRGVRVLEIRSGSGAKAISNLPVTDTGSPPDGVWLNTSWAGYASKGEAFGLYVGFNTGAYPNGRYTIRWAQLNGFMIRDA